MGSNDKKGEIPENPVEHTPALLVLTGIAPKVHIFSDKNIRGI